MALQLGIGLGLIPTAARPAATTAPVNIDKPFFEGPLTQGQSAEVNPGSWTGLPSPNFTYAIKRGATTVSTSPAYVWTAADVAAGADAMTVEVTATNDIGPTTATSDPVTIAGVLQLSGVPTTAFVGAPYSFVAIQSGGHAPYAFALAGTLQAGLTFSTSTGEIDGTPLASGAASLTITVTDADGLTAPLGPFNLTVSSAASPGADATDLSGTGITAAVHYHLPTATVAMSGGRITSITDRMGLADASEGSAGVGPLDVTDGLGRRLARFTNAEWMKIAAALTSDTRALAVFMVMRAPRGGPGSPAQSYFSQGVNGAAPPNTGAATISVQTSLKQAPFLVGNNIAASTDAAKRAKIVVGAQMQVVGVVSRPTANGAQRLYINQEFASVAQIPVAITAIAGAEIGRYAFTPSATGAWAEMDLYELIVVKGVVTDVQAEAIAAAIVANWNIPAITDQVVITGDSLSRGIPPVSGYQSLGALLTNPGSPISLPATTRVVNIAIGGYKIADLVLQRDAANGMLAQTLPGKNIIANHILTNDLSAGTSAASAYASLVAFWNTASTGALQRGWSGIQATNISRTGGTIMASIESLRALIRDPQYLIDTATNVGGTFAGKMGLLELAEIEAGGAKRFSTATDAANTTYYSGDGLHPSVVGVQRLADGGDTPENGYFETIAGALAA